MSALEICIQITEEIIHTAEVVDEENRDSRIEKIDDLLNKREKLLPQIEAPSSEEHKVIGRRLLHLNEVMEKALKKMQTHIQMDINRLNQKKKSAQRYGNPYAASESIDGMFYDKRK